MNETMTLTENPSTAKRGTVRLTTAQAVVRYLSGLRTRIEGPQGDEIVPLFGGVFAIFGHGNVAGIGEALHQYRDKLPTYRAHNEQGMAYAAIAFAKAHFRRRMMACTSSIGPGATNLVTAAALAHVNRLPVLFLPGDIFVSRDPDPVLQQVEDFGDGTVSANDCFRPVSRYFDRIVHPSQLITSLPRAVFALTDPALCGPVTLALPQDVQADAFDFPAEFFESPVVEFRAAPPSEGELAGAVRAVMAAKRPVIIAGGGVLYGGACGALREFADRHGVPVCETQAGKSSLPWDHPLQLGSVGVTGSPASNALASEADLILAVGTRLQDFTTGSNSLFTKARLVSLNVNAFDATKARGIPLRADARLGLEALSKALPHWQAEAAWTERAKSEAAAWRSTLDAITQRRDLGPGSCPTTVRSSEPCSAPAHNPRQPTSWSAPPARFPPSCTSSGVRRPPGAITWNTAIRAWATRLRGPGRQDGPAGSRSYRNGGRRQLPHAQQRDRHLSDARQKAHHCPARQSRLRMHQPPSAALRRSTLQQYACRQPAVWGGRAQY